MQKIIGQLVLDERFREKFTKDPDATIDATGLDDRETSALLRLQAEAAASWILGVDRRVPSAIGVWYGDEIGTTVQAIPNVGYTRLSVHQMMLCDRVRVLAYRRAIANTVRKGDVVLDIGTGSGVLAFFAAQSGAAQVFAVEREQIVELAKKLAVSNGLSDRITFISNDILSAELPSHVDVVISECIGSFGINTFMIRSFIQARDRYLKTNGRTVPLRMRLFIAPVECLFHEWHLGFWQRSSYDIDWSSGLRYAKNQLYTAHILPTELLAVPKLLSTFHFSEADEDDVDATIDFELTREGFLCGLAGWFDVEVAPNVWIHTSPSDPQTSWQQTLLPIQDVRWAGLQDTVKVRLRRCIAGSLIRWRWDVEHNDDCRTHFQKHDSMKSFLHPGDRKG